MQLVTMMGAEDERAAELAALVVNRLAKGNTDVSEAITEAGGIAPLVRLLTHGSESAQQQAASGLAELSLFAYNRDDIANCGALQALIRLLSSRKQGTPELAARAIGRLSREDGDLERWNQKRVDRRREKEAAEERTNSFASIRFKKAEGATSGITSDMSAKEAFELLDADGGGSISLNELASALTMSGLSKMNIQILIDKADVNGDRELQLSEFVTFWRCFQTASDKQSAASATPGAAAIAKSTDGLRCPTVGQVLGKSSSVSVLDIALGLTSLGSSSAQQAPTMVPMGACTEDGVERRTSIDKEDAERSARFRGASERRAFVRLNGGVQRLIVMLEPSRAVGALALGSGGRGSPGSGAVGSGEMGSGEMGSGGMGSGGMGTQRAGGSPRHVTPTGSDSRVCGGSSGRTRAAQRTGSELWDCVRPQQPPEAAYGGEQATKEEALQGLGIAPTMSHEANVEAMREAAAAALVDLVRDDREIQEAFLSYGGVRSLVGLCRSASKGAQEHAANCLWRLCIRTENQSAVVSEGAIPDLVQSVRLGDPDAQGYAAGCLAELARGGSEERLNAIVEAGGIASLVALLGQRSELGKEQAASCLYHLAIDRTNQSLIAKANGITPLVALFNSVSSLDKSVEERRTFEHAANALARLAQISTESQAQIAKRLVMLLSSDKIVVQARAARALRDLAANQPESAVVILNAGALLQLVKMLSSGQVEAQREAAGALSTLAINSRGEQVAIASGLVVVLGSSDPDTQARVTKLLLELCQDADMRYTIVKAGAIPRLIAQLNEPKVQQLAAGVLARLTADESCGAEYVADIAKSNGIPSLVSLLLESRAERHVEAQASAIEVLLQMSCHRPDFGHALCASDALVPLVAVLAGTKHGALTKTDVATIFGNLARQGEQEQAAASITPLVHLVQRDGAPAYAALSDIGPQLVAVVRALTALVSGHCANQVILKASGGIEALVVLLSPVEPLHAVNGREEVRAHAADALAELARGNAENQTAIAAAGALSFLVAQLKRADSLDGASDSDPDVPAGMDDEGRRAAATVSGIAEEAAARALWSLADGHAPNQAAIAAASALLSLVTFLGGSPSSQRAGTKLAQEAATNVLAKLSSNDPSVEATLATMLVAPLSFSDPGPEGGGSGGRQSPDMVGFSKMESAARVISRLTQSSVRHQDAIAAAGGATKLVAMLKRGVPSMTMPISTLDELTRALCSMAVGNRQIQQAIAQHDGIPTLIAMLHGPKELHEGASRTLGALAADVGNRTRIFEAGGIASLIELLGLASASAGAAGAASSALANLALTPALRTAIVGAGGIAPLTSLALGLVAEQSSSAAREHAASALSLLARGNEANRSAVANELVRTLRTGSTLSTTVDGHRPILIRKEEARVLLRDMCVHAHGLAAGDAEDEAPEAAPAAASEATAVVDTPSEATGEDTASEAACLDNRRAFAKAGVIVVLVELLSGPQRILALGVETLCLLARTSRDLHAEVTQALIQKLRNNDKGMRQRAGIALSKVGAEGSEELQRSSALARGVEPLAELLKDALDDDGVEAQAYALWSLCLSVADAMNQAVIVREGCVADLVACLRNPTLPASAQEHAITVLASLAHNGDVLRQAIDADGIPPISAVSLALLASPSSPESTKAHAVGLLAQLAGVSVRAQRQVASVACTPLLRRLDSVLVCSGDTTRTTALELDSSATLAPRLAAHTLEALARHNAEVAATLLEAGAVAPLVVMLHPNRPTADRRAAALLLGTIAQAAAPGQLTGASTVTHRLSSSASVMNVTVGESLIHGAIPALLSMIDPGCVPPTEPGLIVDATRAIRFLSSGEGSLRKAIMRAGGASLLVALLSNSGVGVPGAAPASRANLAPTGAPSDGVSKRVVSGPPSAPAPAWMGAPPVTEESTTKPPATPAKTPATPESFACQLHAAAAVTNLAQGSIENQEALVHARAIPQLASLLRSSESAETHRHAVHALLHFASHEETRTTLAVLRQLVGLLDVPRPATQMAALSTLATLASRGAASRHTIIRSKAIAPLLQMLGQPRVVGQTALAITTTAPRDDAARYGAARSDAARYDATPAEWAASLLSDLASSSEAVEEMVGAQAVLPLGALLSSPSSLAQTSAASTLWRIAAHGDAERAALVSAGAVLQLVGLLTAGASAEATRHATATLWQLSSSAEAMEAMVRAGGLRALVGLLEGDDVAEAQELAAALLALLAQDTTPVGWLQQQTKGDVYQAAMLELGAIPKLVVALGSASQVVKKHAVATLRTFFEGRCTGRSCSAEEECTASFLAAEGGIGALKVLLTDAAAPPEALWSALSILKALATQPKGRTALRAAPGGAQWFYKLDYLATDEGEGDASVSSWLRAARADLQAACNEVVELLC
jgi:vacuolar protein 8